VGVEIGTANCRIVVTDFSGRVLSFKKFPSGVSLGKDHVVELIHKEIKGILPQDGRIGGIGIAQSGVIDRETGTVLFWPKVRGWKDVPLKQIFEKEYGVPTILEDSARMWGIAEKHFGQAKGLSNFICVNVGMGIGSALFLNGQLYVGCGGLAGELGHTTIDENGDLCSCGNRGCLEVYSSGWAILNKVRAALKEGVDSNLLQLVAQDPEGLSIEAIVTAAQAHDRLSETVLTEAGIHLGTALAALANLLNPEKIILGAAVAQAAGPLLLNPLLNSLRRRAFQQSVRNVEVVVSQLGEEAAAVGAVLVVAEQIIRRLCAEEEFQEASLPSPQSSPA
jgi:glucokinase